MASLADQFSSHDNPGIEPKPFYALQRAGIPANEDVLYQTDAVTLSNLWHSAIAQGLINGNFLSTGSGDPIAATNTKRPRPNACRPRFMMTPPPPAGR